MISEREICNTQQSRTIDGESVNIDEENRIQIATEIGRALIDKLNNDLTPPLARLDLVLSDPSLPPHLKARLEQVAEGIEKASKRSRELTHMTRFVRTTSPGNHRPMLDWDRSLELSETKELSEN